MNVRDSWIPANGNSFVGLSFTQAKVTLLNFSKSSTSASSILKHQNKIICQK